MGIFNFYNNFDLMARNLSYLFTRVGFHMPDLEEDTVFIIAARLNMNAYIQKGEINIFEIIEAYKTGKIGLCGLTPDDSIRHESVLDLDKNRNIINWVMQMEYLMFCIDLKRFSSDVVSRQVVDNKKHIVKGIEKVLANTDPNLNVTRRAYEKVITDYKNSPYYQIEKVKIKELLQKRI